MTSEDLGPPAGGGAGLHSAWQVPGPAERLPFYRSVLPLTFLLSSPCKKGCMRNAVGHVRGEKQQGESPGLLTHPAKCTYVLSEG